MSQTKSIRQHLTLQEHTLEESKKRMKDVENSYNKAVTKSQSLEADIKSTKRLLALGLNVARMENLVDTIERISAKHGVSLPQAVEKFFTDLGEYDEQVGFEQHISELEKSSSREESRLESLKVEYETYRPAIDAVIPLLQSGTKSSDFAYLCRLAAREKIDIPALSIDLNIYKSLGRAVAGKRARKRELQDSIMKLTAQKEQLDLDVANIKADGKLIAEDTRAQLARIGEGATNVVRATGETVKQNLRKNILEFEDMQTTMTGLQRTVLSDFEKTMRRAGKYSRLILFEPLARAEAGEQVEPWQLYETGIYALEIVAKHAPSGSLASTSIEDAISLMNTEMDSVKVLSERDDFGISPKRSKPVKGAAEMGLKLLKPSSPAQLLKAEKLAQGTQS